MEKCVGCNKDIDHEYDVNWCRACLEKKNGKITECKCIVCRKARYQEYETTDRCVGIVCGAVVCRTSGNYGSGVLDCDGDMTFVICDDCYRKREKSGDIWEPPTKLTWKQKYENLLKQVEEKNEEKT